METILTVTSTFCFIYSTFHFTFLSLVIVDLILLAALWPWVDLASNRNEYQEFLKIKNPRGTVRPASRADNLAAIY
jgi:hypothetical protein